MIQYKSVLFTNLLKACQLLGKVFQTGAIYSAWLSFLSSLLDRKFCYLSPELGDSRSKLLSKDHLRAGDSESSCLALILQRMCL